MVVFFLTSKSGFFFFYMGAAKKASSPGEIINQLVELGLSSSAETVGFAKEIYSRVEHKTSGPNVGVSSLITFD